MVTDKFGGGWSRNGSRELDGVRVGKQEVCARDVCANDDM